MDRRNFFGAAVGMALACVAPAFGKRARRSKVPRTYCVMLDLRHYGIDPERLKRLMPARELAFHMNRLDRIATSEVKRVLNERCRIGGHFFVPERYELASREVGASASRCHELIRYTFNMYGVEVA